MLLLTIFTDIIFRTIYSWKCCQFLFITEAKIVNISQWYQINQKQTKIRSENTLQFLTKLNAILKILYGLIVIVWFKVSVLQIEIDSRADVRLRSHYSSILFLKIKIISCSTRLILETMSLKHKTISLKIPIQTSRRVISSHNAQHY